MSNLYINVFILFISFLMTGSFIFKKKISSTETNIFSFLLVLNVIDVILMNLFILVSLGYFGDESLALLFNKLQFVIHLSWSAFFFIYIYYISMFADKEDLSRFNLVKYTMTLVNLFVIGFLFFTPVYLINESGNLYAHGEGVNIVYITCGIYFLLSVISALCNFKLIFTKRFAPMFILVIFTIAIYFLKQMDPTILVIPSVLCYINLLMYFTIENPDIKIVDQIEVARLAAERSNVAKADFLASMSHEIRTPLNAIVGLSEYVSSREDVALDIKGDLDDITNASNTLLEIVGNILDMSKIESDKLIVNNGAYSIKKEIDKVVKLNKHRIEDKNLVLDVNIDESIPYELIGDKVHIKSIINNLLSNALKYTEKGFVNLGVTSTIRGNICKLVITVEDSGRGIKDDSLDKLFTKFERLDIDKNTTTEGTGLGLVITKRLVEVMNGKLDIKSVYGEGSTFTVTLDQQVSKLVNDVVENKDEVVNDKIITGKKVLIVDDSKLNIKVARKLLESNYFTIDECYDGVAAINKIYNNTYDLILLDIMMPNVSGEEVLSKLRESGKFNTPIIALTADAISGSRDKYIAMGFDEYLAKPFTKDQMNKAIQNVFKD